MPRKWPADALVESGLTGPPATRDFAQLVQEDLISRYGVNTVLGGGLSVYTTLDLETQAMAREVLYGQTGYLPNPQDPDAALVSIEPGTGYVRAMVGNRDPNSQFNLVIQGQRQPGSSFKPFALIAALEQGIDPKTEFVSEKKEYQVDVPGLDKPEKWKVENYDGIVRGEMTLEEALWWSDNTVFTDLVMNADGRGLNNGPEKIIDVAKRLGVTANFGPHPHPSVVLGTQEVSPLDMARAYATIANEGRRVEPTVVSRVVSNEGREGERVLLDGPPEQEGEQVIDPEIARQATEIMIGDVTQGIAKDAALGPRPVAGKTGTSENFFDAWFVGYTPQLVTGLWMGYGEGGQTLDYYLEYARKLHGLSGGITPAQIWQTYSQEALNGEPVRKFEGIDVPQTREAQAAQEAKEAAPEGPIEATGEAPGDTVPGGLGEAPDDLPPGTTTLESVPGDNAPAAAPGIAPGGSTNASPAPVASSPANASPAADASAAAAASAPAAARGSFGAASSAAPR
jgi:penicillin-binding protein 1A